MARSHTASLDVTSEDADKQRVCQCEEEDVSFKLQNLFTKALQCERSFAHRSSVTEHLPNYVLVSAGFE